MKKSSHCNVCIYRDFSFAITQHCSVESVKALVAFRGPDVNPISAEGTPLDVAGVNIRDDQIKSLLRSVGGESYFTLARRQEATVKLPRSEGQPQLSNSWLRKTFSL
jgi:hypothetical protein